MTTPNIEELIVRGDEIGSISKDDDQSYGMFCAVPLVEILSFMQSQAERIKALGDDLFEANKELLKIILERDTLRAQLEQIAATEPVSRQFQTREDGKWHDFLDDKHYQNTKDAGRWPIRELFSRPMPAESAAEPVIWAISYDGVTPYTLWHEGDGALLDYEVKRQGGTTRKMPLYRRPMPAQDVTELVEALMATELQLVEIGMRGNGLHQQVCAALSKYKGAK